MLVIVSPSKTLNTDPCSNNTHTIPVFLEEARTLNQRLRDFSKPELAKFMKLSPKLTDLNFERIQSWESPLTEHNAKPAIFTYQGDLYDSLHAKDFSTSDLEFAQKHLSILSGLYGVLRPLDLMQPYRLEMGSSLKTERGNNLYRFWGEKITDRLNQILREEPSSSPALLNLASEEYFRSVVRKKLEAPLITANFKERKGDHFKVISFAAKKARGLMTRYIIKNKITSPQEVKSFQSEGYQYNPELSREEEWIFTRE